MLYSAKKQRVVFYKSNHVYKKTNDVDNGQSCALFLRPVLRAERTLGRSLSLCLSFQRETRAVW